MAYEWDIQHRTGAYQDNPAELSDFLDDYGAGIEIVGVYLQSVHPPIEVADAFRDVVNANEEKSRLINLAEAYNKEQLPLARGNVFMALEDARAYQQELIDRSTGDGKKFLLTAWEFNDYHLVTKERLYLETMEKGLSGVKKFVMDKSRTGKSGLTIFGQKDLEGFLNTLSEGLSNTTRSSS